jgi:hypothetical protein
MFYNAKQFRVLADQCLLAAEATYDERAFRH